EKKTETPAEHTHVIARKQQLERIRRLDREAMELLRSGNRVAALDRLLVVAKDYKQVIPSDTSKEEAIIIATVYARIAAHVDDDIDDGLAEGYARVSQAYAKHAGIDSTDAAAWCKQVMDDTIAIYGSNVPVPARKVTTPKEEFVSSVMNFLS